MCLLQEKSMKTQKLISNGILRNYGFTYFQEDMTTSEDQSLKCSQTFRLQVERIDHYAIAADRLVCFDNVLVAYHLY